MMGLIVTAFTVRFSLSEMSRQQRRKKWVCGNVRVRGVQAQRLHKQPHSKGGTGDRWPVCRCPRVHIVRVRRMLVGT